MFFLTSIDIIKLWLPNWFTISVINLGRILAFDFGEKRTGIAVTDELQIIASGLTTVDTKKLFSFLTEYLKNETVELFIVGDHVPFMELIDELGNVIFSPSHIGLIGLNEGNVSAETITVTWSVTEHPELVPVTV